MRILVIGSGGREHALVWKLAQSPRMKRLYCAPGNAGISQIADIVDIKATDIDRLCSFAAENRIDLTVVGPEIPLAEGIVDRFRMHKLRIFGPCYEAAKLEASKVFAKRLMEYANIPTAKAVIFDNYLLAKEWLKKAKFPVAIKADGLCAGKGVRLCYCEEEGLDFINNLMVKRIFKDAGKRIVIEEGLCGDEASFMAITDGKHTLALPTSQDHKRLFDGDEGPNTGGMGAYSPMPLIDEEMESLIMDSIICPILAALKKKEGLLYQGVIYAGLMLTDEGPKVLEFNIRFGDPEAQAVLPRLNTDLLDIIESCVDGFLNTIRIKTDIRTSICVVIASGGYPGKIEIDKPIEGLIEADKFKDVLIFHAGTKLAQGPERHLTNGGRVLNVVSLGDDIEDARKKAYNAIDKIHFDGMHYRKDIGLKAVGMWRQSSSK